MSRGDEPINEDPAGRDDDGSDVASPAIREQPVARRARLVAAAGLLLLAGGTFLLVSSRSEQTEPVQSAVEMVAHDDRAVTAKVGSIEAHNSPAIVQDPNDPRALVVASKIDSPRYGAAVHVSRDAGETWARVGFPTPAGEDRPYAPELAWGSDGTVYMVFVTLTGRGNNPDGVWLTSSRDQGTTWTAPRRIFGSYAFQVRIAIDPTDGDLYLTWLQARAEALGTLSFTQTGLPILASGSTDGGKTWSRPARVSASERERVGAAVPAVAPSGEVYVLFYDFKDDRFDWENLEGNMYQGTFELVVARSRASALDFEEHVVESSVKPVGRFLPYLPTYPSVSIDESSGTIYAVWQDARSGDWDVLLRSSRDGGATWSAPMQVGSALGSDQYMPRVSASSNGRLDVVYLDGRRSTNSYLASSFDAGTSWSVVRLSRVGFSSQVGVETIAGEVDQGTGLGLSSRPDDAYAVWTDARRGTPVSGKLDIFFSRVSFRKSPTD